MVNAKTCQFIQSCIKITRQFTIGYTSLLIITHRTLIDGVTRSKKNWSDGWQWWATQPPLKGTVHKLTCQSQQIWFKLVCHSKTKHPFTSYKRTPETIFSFTYYFKEMLGSDLILDTWKGTCKQNHLKSFIRFIKKRVYLYICLHRCGMQFNAMHPSLWTSHVSCCPQIYIIVSPCTNPSLRVCVCMCDIYTLYIIRDDTEIRGPLLTHAICIFITHCKYSNQFPTLSPRDNKNTYFW